MRGRGGRVLLLVALVVAVVSGAVALTAWLVSDDGDSTAATQPADAVQVARSGRQLARLADPVGHAVYWIGPMAGQQYEFTATEDGRAYVRYLPRGASAGDPRPSFVTVGTYLLENAFAVTRATSRRQDARHVQAPAGAIAFYTTARPQSVYLAYEGSDLQIEVFHPTPREARRLVESGSVRPVG
jgi:hypothetical protein